MKTALGGVASLLIIPVLVLGALGHPSSSMTPAYSESGALESEVLSHPNIALTAAARRDLEAGIADPRVIRLLLALAEHHRLGSVGPIKTGHSYFVRETTRVSNHSYGRAVDIGVVDGAAVSSANLRAYEAVLFVLSLPAPLRPDEVGSPWRFGAKESFSDRAHLDHAHFGWEAKP